MSGLPNETETLLLRAVAGRDDGVLEAWRRWAERIDFDRLPGEQVNLVPLLYRRLMQAGVPRDELTRYASVYRWKWTKNRLSFQACARLVEVLERAGIATMLLKGAAATLLYFKDGGVRAMADVDVLVRPEQLGAALEIAARHGWHVADARDLDERGRQMRNSAQLVDEGRREVDVHWYVLQDARVPGSDDDFWAASVPLQIDGATTRALSPSDFLYVVLGHGFASHAPHLRWVVDAMAVLKPPHLEHIDWHRFVATTTARRTTMAMAQRLGWLADTLAAPVPPWVLDTLRTARVPVIDRLEVLYASQLDDARPDTVSKVLVRMWCAHRRSTTERGVRLALGFPDFLRRYYELPSLAALPPIVTRRVLARLRTSGL